MTLRRAKLARAAGHITAEEREGFWHDPNEAADVTESMPGGGEDLKGAVAKVVVASEN